MKPRPYGWGLLPLLALALLMPLAAPAIAEDAKSDDPVEARAFKVRYRSLTDAADVVGAILSERGSVMLRPKPRLLVVEDRASVLDRVATLLDSFDLPPRRVEVTLSLFLGQRAEKSDDANGAEGSGTAGLSREVRGILQKTSDFTQWTSYEPLGSRAVTGVEGQEVVADLSGDYRVSFTVDSVHDSSRGERVKFERFSLQRETTLGDGGIKIDDLYTAGMVVDAGKLTLVVAASSPDSKRALFLALQVQPRP